jgi:cold shock CspA family protein
MGQETMGKKEKEKKKQKNKRDKEERKEHRKANNNKGKGLEAMMAYVDENGDLSATPPDPRKKKVVNPETIQLGATKREPIDPAELIRKGVVTFFNAAKGYGFITDLGSQESVFVHVNQLTESIQEKDKVTFEIEMGPKGASAANVKKEVKEVIKKEDPKEPVVL